MVQGKLKKTVALPKGVKTKAKKMKPQGPKKGRFVHIAPKKAHVIEAEKVSAHVTKVINDKNEEMIKGRADTAVGRTK